MSLSHTTVNGAQSQLDRRIYVAIVGHEPERTTLREFYANHWYSEDEREVIESTLRLGAMWIGGVSLDDGETVRCTIAPETRVSSITCKRCDGRGEIAVASHDVGNSAINDDFDVCPACSGSGTATPMRRDRSSDVPGIGGPSA